MQAAGPLLALLGFLNFPFIWSIPEALITAEGEDAIVLEKLDWKMQKEDDA